ncbi:nuclear transport factor 2 family protein [Klebsiella pneumoniae]|uniref:nuclear transport factor 2 family protein n=2 Tax=Klebsiella pneumoniae TaxID=573 RepID=UPI000B407754|nr:nuclear transport factor 2 family protein [Klebsiella pneumoniae]RNR58849.1 nuclear transport factor 2 family protein [Klebsiella pneumoniae]
MGPDPRNFNQRVSLGRNDLLIRTFHNKWEGLDGFAQHARRLREIIAFAKIELHDELRNGNLYATRHRVLCTRRSGEEVDMEVYMFAEIDDSGRFIRIEEATLMLKGRESDRDLGSVR